MITQEWVRVKADSFLLMGQLYSRKINKSDLPITVVLSLLFFFVLIMEVSFKIASKATMMSEVASSFLSLKLLNVTDQLMLLTSGPPRHFGNSCSSVIGSYHFQPSKCLSLSCLFQNLCQIYYFQGTVCLATSNFLFQIFGYSCHISCSSPGYCNLTYVWH